MRPQIAYDHKAACLECDITVGMARYKKEKKKNSAHTIIHNIHTNTILANILLLLLGLSHT